jgi:hypothetical protein
MLCPTLVLPIPSAANFILLKLDDLGVLIIVHVLIFAKTY